MDEKKEGPLKDTPTQPEPHPHKVKPKKALGERLIPWGQFLAIVTGAILGGYATFFKGEPKADKTWEVLRTQVNAQSEAINKLHLRMVFLQAHQEGQNTAALQLKLDQLQVRYDALLKQIKIPAATPKAIPKAEPKAAPKPAPPPDLDKMKKALEDERKRLESERRQQEKIRKAVEQTQKKDSPLQALPKSPEDKF